MSLSSVRMQAMVTYPIITLSAPNGVIKIGGANVYATKLRTVHDDELGTPEGYACAARTLAKDH